MRRKLVRIGCWLVGLYLLVLIVLTALQVDLIFPGHQSQGSRKAEVVAPSSLGAERVEFRSKANERIVALFGTALRSDGSPHPDPGSRPTMMFFYGNGMHLSQLEDLFEFFRTLEINVLIPEYLGYGASEGKAGETSCFATADAAYEYLQSRTDINPQRIIASGWSLGGAVAINLASRKPVIGLAVFSTFVNMADLVKRHFPIVPIFLLQHRFESLDTLAQITCPIFIGHGENDDLVPFSNANRLAEVTQKHSTLTRLNIPHAGHNDFFAYHESHLRPTLSPWLNSL